MDIIRIAGNGLFLFVADRACVRERTALSFSQHQQNEKFLITTPQPPRLTIQHLLGNDGHNEDKGHKVNPNLATLFDVCVCVSRVDVWLSCE